MLPWAQDQATVPLSQAFSAKAQAERSFHVFYELLAGLDPTEREQLSLQEPETYHYLNQVGAGPAQGRVLVGGGLKRSWGRARPGGQALLPTPAVLRRARPAGSRARRMPRTSRDW